MPLSEYEETLAQQEPTNPYRDTLEMEETASAIRLRHSLGKAAAKNPDQQADILRFAERMRLPPDLVERNYESLKKRAAIKDTDFAKMLRETPHTAEFLSDPDNAAIAKDDHDQLGHIETLLNLGKSFVASGLKSSGAGLSGISDYFSAAGRSYNRAIQALGLPPIDVSLPWWLSPLKAVGGELQADAPFYQPSRSTFGTELAGSLGGLVPLIAAGIVLGPEASAAMFAGQGADAIQERAEQLGKAGTVGSDIGMLSNAAVSGLAGEFGIEGLLERLPPNIRSFTLQKLADLTISSGYQAGLQFALQLASNVAIKLSLDPNQPLAQDLLEQATLGGATGAIARAILGVALPSLGGKLQRMETARQNKALFEALGEGATNSKTFQRLPERLQKFVLSATKDGPIENVYVPAEDAARYFQDKNIDPDAVLGEGARDKLNQAVASGNDLQLTTAEYTSAITPSEHAAFFNDIVRLGSPEAMNAREAEAFASSVNDQQIQTNMERADADEVLDRSAARVREDIVGQLTGTGFPPNVVDAYAEVYYRGFRAMGKRLGDDPFALYEPYRLKITRPLPEILRTLPDIDTQLDPLIDRLRSGKTPTPEEMFGKSLVDFLRENGGVKDEGGDLASREPDKERKPFQKRLINDKKGLPLDRARELAAEAGYIDKQSTIADFLDAIDKEVRGEPVFAQGQEQPEAIEQNIILEQLDQYLKSRDVDIRTASNEEIRKVLKDAAQVPAIDAATGTLLAQPGVPPGESKRFSPSADFRTPRLTGTEVGDFAGKPIEQIRQEGRQWAEQLKGIAPIERPGFRPFEFTNQTLNKIFNASDRTKIELLPTIPEILQRGEHLGSRPDRKGRSQIKAHHYFLGNAALGGRELWVRVTAREYINGNVVYDIYYSPDEQQAREIPSRYARSAEPEAGGGTTLSQSIGSDLNLDKRGTIHFGPNREFSIELLKDADLSTFLHETGHFYLEVFGDIVDDLRTRPGELSDQQQRMVADYDTALKWLGVESRDKIGKDQHEQFARGFEAYLREGKAPAPELRPIFQRFKGWLKNIYRSLTQLNVNLTEDVRGVFDRLLASDQEIQRAREDAQIREMIESQGQADRLGLSPEEYRAYGKTVQEARDRAQETLDREYLDEFNRASADWYQKQRATVRNQVASEVHGQRDYMTLAFLKDGTLPDGSPLPEGVDAFKLDAKALEERYGRHKDSSVMQQLRKSDIYRREGGIDPDAAAELFGYSSGDEMIQALVKLRPMDALIDAETTDRMKHSTGDMLTDGSAPEKAREAVMTEGRAKVIEAEMRALAKKVRETAPLRQLGAREAQRADRQARARGLDQMRRFVPSIALARDIANQRIAEMRARDITPGLYFTAARKEANLALEAVNRGDFDEALTHKQRELVNVEMYRATTEWKKEEAKIRDTMRSFDDPKKRQRIGKAGEDYLDQIDKLRERFEFSRQTNKALDRRADLKDFIEAERAKGHELDIPLDIQREAWRQNYKDMTVEQLRGLNDAVRSIEHWAQFKNKLLRNVAKRELDQLAADGAGSIDGNSKGPRKVEFEPRLPGAETKRDIHGWLISHRPLLAILREMDGFKDGFMFENLWQPAHEARNAKAVMGREAAEAWDRIQTERFRGEEASLYQPTFIPELGGSLSTAARLVVALNYGNEGNRERLRSNGIGNTGPLSEAKIQAILNTLTERDWKYVQDMATLIASYKEPIGALYERVTGVAPKWVEPSPFQTKFGEMPGWYYPIMYDGRASARALPGPDATFADIIAKSSYMRFQTANGHTEARTEHTGIPLRADLGVIGEHLEQVIHDVTHREMLIDVGRILGHKQIQEAIYRNYGDQYYREIQATFRDVAIGPAPPPSWYRILQPVRRNYAMARLAWNFSTVVRHVTNITNGMVRVGPWDVTTAVIQSLGSAKDVEYATGFIAANSETMAGRWLHRIEGIREIQQDIGANRGEWAAVMRDQAVKAGVNPDIVHLVADSYLYGIHKVIQMAEIPTWRAAYRQAIEAGRMHGDAVASADAAILDAFGGGDTLDLPGVQRSYSGKLFTTFMQYGFSLHRQNYEIFHKDAAIGRKIVDATLLNIVPVVFLGALFHQVHDKKSFTREMVEGFFEHTLGEFVYARELTSALASPDYHGPASMGAFGTLTRLIYQTEQAILKESPERAAKVLKTTAEVVGQAFGVPTNQIEKTAAGLMELYEGKLKNPMDLLDLLMGPPAKQ